MQGVNLPAFSLAERDRRYKAARFDMAARGIDCLIAPQNTGEWDACQPDARYLTSIGGGGTAIAAVLPIEGPPIAIIRESRRVDFWKHAQDWVTNIRGTVDGRWGEALGEAIRDLGHTQGRIGVAGLEGVLRFPDGIVTHGEFKSLRDILPDATFINATEFLHDIRMIKSTEETTMIEHAQRCADAISEAAFAAARPGATEHEVYAKMTEAHIRNGGEVPAMILIGIGEAPNQTYLLPTIRKLKRNDILICESEVKYAGYMAQSIEALSLGSPPSDYQRLFEASLECFNLLLEMVKPGVLYAELIRKWEEHMIQHGCHATPTLGHGLGLGQDGPTLKPGGDAQGRVIEAGHCFVMKPWATSDDGQRAIRTGNSILVDENGARRMGHLDMEFRILD